MNLMLLMGLFIMFLANMMMLISMVLSKKSLCDREKITAFECGFDPSSSSRVPFSLRFFLISIMFLIFDVEIVLLLPIINLLVNSDLYCWFITSYFFILILLFGLFYEWYKGALDWSS